MHSDPNVMRYIRPPEKDLEETKVTLKEKILSYMQEHPGYGNWAIHLRGNNCFIGWVLLKHLEDSGLVEIGYRLHEKFWGSGYATEAAIAMREHAFQTLQLSKVVGITHPENLASQHVLQKVGMQNAGMARFFNMDVAYFEMKNPDL